MDDLRPNDPLRGWLLDAMRYDHWANLRWAPLVMGTLEGMTRLREPDEVPTEPVARAADTFAHILRGQRRWLAMCGVEVVGESAGWLVALHAAWIAEIERRDPDEIVAFTMPDGTPRAYTFAQIVRHIANHGTYHRGGLREIVEPALDRFPAAGLVDGEFPETDLTLWLRETGRARADKP